MIAEKLVKTAKADHAVKLIMPYGIFEIGKMNFYCITTTKQKLIVPQGTTIRNIATS